MRVDESRKEVMRSEYYRKDENRFNAIKWDWSQLKLNRISCGNTEHSIAEQSIL